MQYALWVKCIKPQPTELVDTQTLCNMSIMHYDLMHYEKADCKCFSLGNCGLWLPKITIFDKLATYFLRSRVLKMMDQTEPLTLSSQNRKPYSGLLGFAQLSVSATIISLK
jgi:hypothetical protein